MEYYPSAPVPSVQVDYQTGRDMIKDGDLISFFASHEESKLHQITTKSVLYFTGSRIYHTGIAFWMEPAGQVGEKRLMLCESVGVGRRLVNLSHFEDHKMEVHVLPAEYDSKKVVNYMLDGIGTAYAFFDLIKIGANEFFNGTPKTDVPAIGASLVCSETAAAAWQYAGFPFDSVHMSPGRLRNYLGTKGVPPTIMINPQAGD